MKLRAVLQINTVGAQGVAAQTQVKRRGRTNLTEQSQ